MTELDRTWAETQIEAMADGSLTAGAKKRMAAAMQRDPELAARVEAARALRPAIKRLGRAPVPRGLMWRLWCLPAARGPRLAIWLPLGTATAIAVASVGWFGTDPGPALPSDAEAAALQDFAITVAYIQKGAVLAGNEINEAVGSGVLTALAASRGMMNRTERDTSGGEPQNVD